MQDIRDKNFAFWLEVFKVFSVNKTHLKMIYVIIFGVIVLGGAIGMLILVIKAAKKS